jgi:hypothetical protein
VTDSPRGTTPVLVQSREEAGLVTGVLLEIWNGGVRWIVVDDDDLARKRHTGEDAIEARHDRFPLVVRGDDDRYLRRHTRTPAPRRFEMSTTGTSG